MKTVCLLVIILTLVHCSKDRKDKNDKPAPDLAKGLLAYFQLNGSFDDSANNFDVSYGGFISDVKNRYGYSHRAYYFYGGFFSFPTPFWSANPMTISLWVKPATLEEESYLILSNEMAFGILQLKSKIGLQINNPDDIAAMGDITTEWSHLVCTYDGNDIKAYINGKLANTAHHPGVADVTTYIKIGSADLPEWKGAIDDVRFYNRVLNAEEIGLLYKL